MILPDKPSELIRLALDHLKLFRYDDNYIIDMGVWFRREHGRCTICFAGGVIAGCLNPESDSLTPDSFDKDTGRKLVALDYLRVGNIQYGLSFLGVSYAGIKGSCKVVGYNRDPDAFIEDMEAMVKYLQEKGL